MYRFSSITTDTVPTGSVHTKLSNILTYNKKVTKLIKKRKVKDDSLVTIKRNEREVSKKKGDGKNKIEKIMISLILGFSITWLVFTIY